MAHMKVDLERVMPGLKKARQAEDAARSRAFMTVPSLTLLEFAVVNPSRDLHESC